MWINPDDVSATQTLQEQGDEGNGFITYMHNGSLYAGAWARQNDDFNDHFLETSAIETGTWQHVAYVLDTENNRATLYLDGEQVASAEPGTVPLPNGTEGSGNGFAQTWGTAQYHDSSLEALDEQHNHLYDGQMDNLRMWRGALSQREIRSRMHRQIWNTKYSEDGYGLFGRFGDEAVLADTIGHHFAFNFALDAESNTSWGYFGVNGMGVAGFDVNMSPEDHPNDPGDAVYSTAPITTGLVADDTTGNAGAGPAMGSVEVTVAANDTLLVSYFGDPNGEPIGVPSDAAEKRLPVAWSMTSIEETTLDAGSVMFDFSNNGPDVGDAEVDLLMRKEVVSDGELGDWMVVTDNWTQSGQTFTNDASLTLADGTTAEFAIGGTEAPLPVELTSFDGAKTESGVQLTWQTASETNNAGFQVQRKATGDWAQVGYVKSKAQGGTTEQGRTYRFADADLPFEADELTYRLKQVDLDGSETPSDPITIDLGPVDRLQVSTYPNPVQDRATVNFAVPGQEEASPVTLRLYNMLGQQVRAFTSNDGVGRHTRTLDLSDLASGVYFMQMEAGGQTTTERFTVVQ